MEEGCLCLPGVLIDVKRSEKVKVEGLNEKREEIVIDATFCGYNLKTYGLLVLHITQILMIDKDQLRKNPFFRKFVAAKNNN